MQPGFYQQLQDIYTGSSADFSEASYETLCDEIAHKAKVIIRSGSFNPWANIALIASTDPFAWFDAQSKNTPQPACLCYPV
ncbi:hypothetical protein SGU81_26600 [Klebsiella pneumoniae]|nr:hypothetical protein [Klebsiella pneumoniae]MDX4490547.1 hypothetical protein [Klebsiella pneumoniae]